MKENMQNVSVGDGPIVVSAQGDTSERKKLMDIVLIALAVIVIIAIVAGVAVSLSKKKGEKPVAGQMTEQEETGGFLPEDENTDYAPVTMAEDVKVTFDSMTASYADDLLNHIEVAATTAAVKPEMTTSASVTQKPQKPQVSTTKYFETTTVKTDSPAQGSAKVRGVIKSFFDGVYYLDGTMVSGGDKTPMEMAMKGNDFQVFSEMDGTDMAIVQLDGSTYLLNPETKKYTELNASIKKMMGITDETFAFSFAGIKFDAENPSSVTAATHNGREAVCYTYKNDKNHLEFIAVGDEIVQFIVYGSSGEPETVLELDEFSSQIPEEMFNFKGYRKTNMISFMTAMM